MTETTTAGRYAPRSAPDGFFADRAWAHQTSRFRALAHDFTVYSESVEFGRYLEHVLVDLAAPGEAATSYFVVDRGKRSRKGRWAVYFGDERLSLTSRISNAIGMLLWHVNQETVRRTNPDMVLLHAAAAELHGVGVVLPAPMDSGKTTTVAGLLRAGFRYLTDEAVAIHPQTGWVSPFAKPLSIDRGSWPVLPDLEPPTVLAYTNQWHVPAGAIRPGALGNQVLPRLIVSPQFRAGAATTLEPVSRGRMLVELGESTFHFHEHAIRNFTALAELARRCDCYRLVIGDLDEAVALVTGLVRTTATLEAS
jgi:hypothetical protein